MSAYVDCLACACLIRAKEQRCPFCGTSLRHAPAPSRLALGFSLGLGLALFGCGDKDGNDTEGATAADSVNDNSDPTYEADAVTYGGPDSWTDSGPSDSTLGGTTITTNDPNDSSEADAVTYAGPDETDSIWGTTDWATDSATTATTVDTQGTMSGTDTDGASGTTGGTTTN